MGSDSSSDQEITNRSLSPDHGSKDGLGRSYECTFCKRGFTNAQALGGHMNIHRKDKAKAKQKVNTFTTTTTTATTATASASQPDKDHLKVSSRSFKLVPNEDAPYVGSSFGFQTGDHGRYYTPSNPNFPWSHATRFNSQSEGSTVNLNLGIGTTEIENGGIGSKNIGRDWFENDVDLELRLGQYP